MEENHAAVSILSETFKFQKHDDETDQDFIDRVKEQLEKEDNK